MNQTAPNLSNSQRNQLMEEVRFNSSGPKLDGVGIGGAGVAAYLPTPNIIVLSAVYIVFTTLGLIGNGAVISMIVRILWSRRTIINVYLYVLCLSAVDFVFLATGPITIAFVIGGNWIYGAALCKLVFFCEGLNKTVSVYLLVILSADRYLAVCKPATSSRYRSIKASASALLVLVVSVLITNIPIYKYAMVKRFDENDTDIAYCGMYFPKLDDTVAEFDTNPWNHLGSYYTLTLVICYYVVPAALICFFYVKLLSRLKQRDNALRKRSGSNRRKKVTMSILLVVVFYFVCWSPYWLLQMIIQFVPHTNTESEETHAAFLYLATSIYTLPYVNSSIDPILYAFLNKRLRKAYADTSRRRKSELMNSEATAESGHRLSRSFYMRTITTVNRTRTSSPSPIDRAGHEDLQEIDAILTPLTSSRPENAF